MWCNEREHVGVGVPRAIVRVVGVLGREKCTRKYAGMWEEERVLNKSVVSCVEGRTCVTCGTREGVWRHVSRGARVA